MSASYMIVDDHGSTLQQCFVEPALTLELKEGQRLSLLRRIEKPCQHEGMFEMRFGTARATTEMEYPRNGGTMVKINILGDNVWDVLILDQKLQEYYGMETIPYNFEQRLQMLPTTLKNIRARISWLLKWILTGKVD